MDNFDEQVIAAVVAHMGDDHSADNLIIARANGAPEADKCEFVNLDKTAGYWRATEGDKTYELKIDWPSGKINERSEIRREVVFVFRDACKKLGIDPNSEEGASDETVASDDTVASDNTVETPFSQVLREGSWGDHDDSEGADFMASIMRGTASLEDYVQLVVQHYYMYEALEEVAEAASSDARFASFHDVDLSRMQLLENDLTKLIGDDWREKISATPATIEYADRIRELGEQGWVPGIVAHHYTRYLGDLSGGQMISKRVAKQHGFDDGKGVEFYDFKALGSLSAFKDRYRQALDVLGRSMDDAERQRMLDEVRTAYRFNTAVFIDMARAKASV